MHDKKRVYRCGRRRAILNVYVILDCASSELHEEYEQYSTLHVPLSTSNLENRPVHIHLLSHDTGYKARRLSGTP